MFKRPLRCLLFAWLCLPSPTGDVAVVAVLARCTRCHSFMYPFFSCCCSAAARAAAGFYLSHCCCCCDCGHARVCVLSSTHEQQQTTAAIYAAYVTAQSLTLSELLEAFPSCKPTPGVLLALLPPLPPRLYSVASSQLATPDAVSVAFSVVSFQLPYAPPAANGPAIGTAAGSAPTTPVGPPGATPAAAAAGGSGGGFVTRRGLCTNWLEGILAPFLEESGSAVRQNGGAAAVSVNGGGGGGSSTEGTGGAAAVTVPVFLKPTKEFLLPASAKWPCVLIGPGTG